MTSTRTITVAAIGEIPVTLTDTGEGRPVLLLHGGGGPPTVAGLGEALASTGTVRVVAPVHPGFDGTPRPDALADMRSLAATYAALLDALELDDVVVIGNSIGGWIAAELAAVGSPRVGSVVLVDAVGLAVDGHPVADFFSLTFPELAELSYHEPERFVIDPTALPPEAQRRMAGNRASLEIYAGHAMVDPTLRDRLAAVTVPALVVWGEADRIVDPEVGRAYAAAITGAEFVLLERAGHLPQLERPDALLATLRRFGVAAAQPRPSNHG